MGPGNISCGRLVGVETALVGQRPFFAFVSGVLGKVAMTKWNWWCSKDHPEWPEMTKRGALFQKLKKMAKLTEGPLANIKAPSKCFANTCLHAAVLDSPFGNVENFIKIHVSFPMHGSASDP